MRAQEQVEEWDLAAAEVGVARERTLDEAGARAAGEAAETAEVRDKAGAEERAADSAEADRASRQHGTQP